MSLPVFPISDATIETFEFYLPNSVNLADSFNIQVDILTYLDPARWITINRLEKGWWPDYITRVAGEIYKANQFGQLDYGIDPNKFIKSNEWLRKLDVYGAVNEFYKANMVFLVSKDETIKENAVFINNLYEDTYKLATDYSNFYDLFGDGGTTTSLFEERYDIQRAKVDKQNLWY